MIVQLLTDLLPWIAVILIAIAQLAWSWKYREAKNAQIDTLKEQVAFFRDLTPTRIVEFMKGLTAQVDHVIEVKGKELKDAQEEVEEKDQEIVRLRSAGEARAAEVEKLRSEKANLEETAGSLKTELDGLKDARTKADPSKFLDLWRTYSIVEFSEEDVKRILKGTQAAFPGLEHMEGIQLGFPSDVVVPPSVTKMKNKPKGLLDLIGKQEEQQKKK